MKKIFRILSSAFLGLAIILMSELSVGAVTLAVPNGASNYDFSIMTTGSNILAVGGVVNVGTNGCPNASCPFSFWSDSFTVSMYDQAHNLLAMNNGGQFEGCSPSSCSVPTVSFFSIPSDTTSFVLSNIVSVGGGWSFESASLTITAGDAEISETPIPASLPLFVSGLGMMGLFVWSRKRKYAFVT